MDVRGSQCSWTAQAQWDGRDLDELELRRVDGGMTASGISLGDTVNAVYTHWWGGRTQPCPYDGCPACQAATERRYNGYIALMSPKSTLTIIYQVTRVAGRVLEREQKKRVSLRGCMINLIRTGKAKHSKLVAVVSDGPIDKLLLPPCPDVRLRMERIWGLTQLPLPLATALPDPTNAEAVRQASNGRPNRLVRSRAAIANGRVDGRGDLS